MNMAMTVDGKITSAAREYPEFTSATDRKTMDRLRAEADAVLVGAGTLRADDPPLHVRDPEMREYRRRSGKPDGLLNVVVSGSADRYAQGDENQADKLVPEGVEGRVPYRGHLAEYVYQLIGGLRAGMGYCGTRTIDELRSEARFIQITAASVRENHPHDIAITQESPNYSVESTSASEAT